jgi:hypothetical protein
VALKWLWVALPGQTGDAPQHESTGLKGLNGLHKLHGVNGLYELTEFCAAFDAV